MVRFFFENDFNLKNRRAIKLWLAAVANNEQKAIQQVNFIFCNDDYLLEKNIKYLKHNTLTDIIGFDYSQGELILGDIFISIERVAENALTLRQTLTDELHRVMVHGLLHYCGYKDKSLNEKELMRNKEDYYLSLRSF
ncbi:MAG: rRNA maturation RNase YbeY [Flavobacteriaceae bacterium]|nr:rRNA maturation RNase YbeY [Flavobacteriaceae bacterium]